MARITNLDERPRIYDDSKVDVNNLYIDDSAMPKEFEDNIVQLQNAAASSLKQRKPIYNFKTKNKSFLNLYNDLYNMGIKNNKFFLKLYDKDLLTIDPYSPILPKDLQLKILLECFINPWYYVREIARIPVTGLPIEPGGGVQFKADRGNIASWYLFLNGIDQYNSKPRQQGKTQNALCEFLYAFQYGTLSTQMLFFNKDQPQAAENLARAKDQRDLLPSWMQMRTFIDENGKADNGKDNVRSWKNPITNNEIKVMGKATSMMAAQKMGRGATAPLQLYDETDFTPYLDEILGSASLAYSKAAEVAASNKSLYGRLFCSTPGDLDTKEGAWASEWISRMFVWKDEYYDRPINQIKATLSRTDNNGIVFVEHNWRQLKLTNAWYEKQCKLLDYNELRIMREIDLKRVHGSNQSPFKRSDIIYLTKHQKNPIKSLDLQKNFLYFNIYENFKPNIPYILVVDPSEGLMEDNNAVTIINPYSQKPICEFKCNYISQKKMYELLCTLMDQYCPRSMIVIENNKGRELINYFLDSRYKYNLYYDDSKLLSNITEKVDKYGSLVQEANQRRAYGLSTTRSNRPKYFAILENVVEERKELIYTEYLVDDVCGLIRKPSGKVEAGPGKHDDNIMSYLMGLYIYYNAPDELLERYGIIRGASDPNMYDNEGKELTEEESVRQLKMLAQTQALPPELQQILNDTLTQRNEVDDSWDYYKQLEDAKKNYSQLPSEMNAYEKLASQNIIQSGSPLDDTYWANFDNEIIKSNFERYEHSQFDINDYID